MATSFLNLSPILNFSIPPNQISKTLILFNCYPHRKWVGRVHCKEPESEPETVSSKASPSSSTSSVDSGISTYSWCAGLGGLGFLETAYLTYLKLTDSDAFCPVGAGTCGDVLSSSYASVFGVPLPLIGMFAYGLVTILGLRLSGKKILLEVDEDIGRLILLGATTSMATASAYFLYILSTRFEGVTCSYCLLSALLSFTLFFTTVQDFSLQEVQRRVGLQLCLGGLVIAILSTSYSSSQSVAAFTFNRSKNVWGFLVLTLLRAKGDVWT